MTSDELAISVDHLPEGMVIHLGGTLDTRTHHLLDDVDVAGRRVVLDASGLSFCDSSGISALLGLHKRAESLTLRGVHGVLARVLRVTGLDALFEVEG
ncbi:STAS domain-containing protein [Nonomuraea sediminis]|uniref:STAS domain-containing protein n=1 Tax=Nonomuraea sediminis TaxID=2835864 RepID=UPI001BDDA0F8|nr:STAS domain-containing protein [Nonomuraea sediminis]